MSSHVLYINIFGFDIWEGLYQYHNAIIISKALFKCFFAFLNLKLENNSLLSSEKAIVVEAERLVKTGHF